MKVHRGLRICRQRTDRPQWHSRDNPRQSYRSALSIITPEKIGPLLFASSSKRSSSYTAITAMSSSVCSEMDSDVSAQYLGSTSKHYSRGYVFKF